MNVNNKFENKYTVYQLKLGNMHVQLGTRKGVGRWTYLQRGMHIRLHDK